MERRYHQPMKPLQPAAVVALSLAFAGAASIAPRSGAAMCALTPADFESVGIRNTAKPSANVQDAGAGAYCVYAGKSSATGGIELDVFYPAGASAMDVKETFDGAIAEQSAQLRPAPLPGADDARWTGNAVSGGPPFAIIAVRRGSLVFVLGVPSGADAQSQLTKLAGLVLQRF